LHQPYGDAAVAAAASVLALIHLVSRKNLSSTLRSGRWTINPIATSIPPQLFFAKNTMPDSFSTYFSGAACGAVTGDVNGDITTTHSPSERLPGDSSGTVDGDVNQHSHGHYTSLVPTKPPSTN